MEDFTGYGGCQGDFVTDKLAFAPPLLSSIFQGGFTGRKKNSAQITTNAFSYIRTESGASRAMRVGVMLFKYYEVLFLE